MKPVRVLIVDDSATMRSLISAALSRDAGIVVVGQAPRSLAGARSNQGAQSRRHDAGR